jgi:RND family efflux transporter MFP subunit
MNRLFLFVFLVPVFALASAAHASETGLLSAEQARALGVVIDTLGPAGPAGVEGLTAQVGVPNDRMFAVSAPLASLVENVAVVPGDRVRRGQTLARLASPELAQTQRGLMEAQAQEQLASASLERDRKLLAEGIIARSRVAASQSRALEARAALRERRQALRLAGIGEATLARMLAGDAVAPVVAVSSPTDGVVLEQSVIAGQRVEASALLFRIARTDQLALEIYVPSGRIESIAVGDQVEVPGRARGTVVAIGAGVNPVNQTVPVRAAVTQGAQALRLGEFVQVTLVHAGAGAAQGFSVPSTAVVRSAGQAYLFVETPEGLRAQPVKVVSAGAQESLVAGALQPGMRIAVRGTAGLKAALLGGTAK